MKSEQLFFDHVINHGLQEAGQRLQPNLSILLLSSAQLDWSLETGENRYVTKICSTPHVIVYQLGDNCLLHEWLNGLYQLYRFLELFTVWGKYL